MKNVTQDMGMLALYANLRMSVAMSMTVLTGSPWANIRDPYSDSVSTISSVNHLFQVMQQCGYSPLPSEEICEKVSQVVSDLPHAKTLEEIFDLLWSIKDHVNTINFGDGPLGIFNVLSAAPQYADAVAYREEVTKEISKGVAGSGNDYIWREYESTVLWKLSKVI